jgi:hypothetical protein
MTGTLTHTAMQGEVYGTTTVRNSDANDFSIINSDGTGTIGIHAQGSNGIVEIEGGETVYLIAYNRPVQVSGNGLDLSNHRIESVADPVDSGDATNKGYVDARIWKGSQAEYDALGVWDDEILYVISS